MSRLGGLGRRARRAMRRCTPRTGTRLLGLRKHDRGQTPVEYVGLGLVVVAIIGALVATGIGQELTVKIGAQVCRITGGGNCGDTGGGSSGGTTQADGEQPQDPPGPGDFDPTDYGVAPGEYDGQQTPEQQELENAQKDVNDSKTAFDGAKDKAVQAAKELAKILADELGITAAFDCITTGDAGACTETLINILTSLIGGAVGKLAAKYGAPWKWKKAYKLIQAIKKHGGDLYDGLKNLIKNRKALDKAEDRLKLALKKCEEHSFLPGTGVVMAGGRQVPIERVRIGDRVLVTDPVTRTTTTRRVKDTITTERDKEFVRLTVREAGRTATLTATDTHPFWQPEGARWAEAGDLRTGDALLNARGQELRITGVFRYERRQRTHDLTIEGIPTYYVVIGDQAVLVHNNDKKGKCSIAEAMDPDDPKHPSNWSKPSWDGKLKTRKVGDVDGGDGAWANRPRNPPENPITESWRRYQEQVTGTRRGQEYVVKNPKGGKDVEFDGWDSSRQAYLEAKNGYGGMVKDGEFLKPTADKFLDEARRQLEAAQGKTVEWHFSNKEAYEAAQKLFKDMPVEVKFTQAVP
ncbi:Tox-REase-5 domain-containing protein [Streptomyces sp. NPDC001941]|uniref:Tox-REase-5 domain-containing protein n=1 Tax=Streptomyces sp. NPDC001941 TaxID=3154659 RepID=UPI00331880FD